MYNRRVSRKRHQRSNTKNRKKFESKLIAENCLLNTNIKPNKEKNSNTVLNGDAQLYSSKQKGFLECLNTKGLRKKVI